MVLTICSFSSTNSGLYFSASPSNFLMLPPFVEVAVGGLSWIVRVKVAAFGSFWSKDEGVIFKWGMFSESSIISKWVQFKVRMLLKEKSMGGPSSASSLLFYLSSLTFFWLAYCFISIYSQFYWIIYYGVQAKYQITAHSRIPFCVPIRLTRNIINMQT